MSVKETYFRLSRNCFLVSGVARGAIYNLEVGDVIMERSSGNVAGDHVLEANVVTSDCVPKGECNPDSESCGPSTCPHIDCGTPSTL